MAQKSPVLLALFRNNCVTLGKFFNLRLCCFTCTMGASVVALSLGGN